MCSSSGPCSQQTGGPTVCPLGAHTAQDWTCLGHIVVGASRLWEPEGEVYFLEEGAELWISYRGSPSRES